MDLKTWLIKNKVWHNFVEKRETVHTAAAAAASGVPLSRITKSLVLLNENNEPVMAVVAGDKKVDKNKLKEALDCKDVELVPFAEAEKYSGYPPGATCPVCHKKQMKVVVDKGLLEHGTVFNGGGARQTC